MESSFEKRNKLEHQVENREIGENIEDLEKFLKEHIGEVYAVLDLVRHGDTEYTNEYPDLSDKGVQQIKDTADEIIEESLMLDRIANKVENLDFKQDLLLVSSPAVRTRGSLKIIEDQLEANLDNENINIQDLTPNQDDFDDEGVVRTKNTIGNFELNEDNKKEATELLMSLAGANSFKDWEIRPTDYAYVNSPELEERDDLWETRSKVRDRTIGSLNLATRVLNRYKEKFNNVPHVIATSHFETLNNLVLETFDPSKKIEDDEFISTGQRISLLLLQPEEEDLIPMVISFKDKTKKVIFDRNEKKFI